MVMRRQGEAVEKTTPLKIYLSSLGVYYQVDYLSSPEPIFTSPGRGLLPHPFCLLRRLIQINIKMAFLINRRGRCWWWGSGGRRQTRSVILISQSVDQVRIQQAVIGGTSFD